MKTIVSALALTLLGTSLLWGHQPLLDIEDNGDGTIYVSVGFSNGDSGAGHKVSLISKINGRVLKEVTVPETGDLDVPIPDVPYIVQFDGGAPGHIVKKSGPRKSKQASLKAKKQQTNRTDRTEKVTKAIKLSKPVQRRCQPPAKCPPSKATPTRGCHSHHGHK
jgi:hypothetical protein